MSRETLGYVKLEWTCPKCGARNPGPEKTCLGCGAPQPADVQFVQASGVEASQDEALRKMAEKGADIHCPFCGTRNPAGTEVCSQCGGDLVHGVKREAGRVVGAYTAGPVKQIACPNCGTLNPETAHRCSQCGAPLGRSAEPEKPDALAADGGKPRSNVLIYALVAGAVLLVICVIAGLLFAASPKETRRGTVQSVGWQTSVAIEALRPVTRQNWQEQVPAEAELGNCVDKVRTTVSSEPAGGNYTKVCGTPYTIDSGSGVGQVVQDCQFDIYEPYCEYTVQEWQVVDQAQLSGSDFNPLFASPALTGDQRLGGQRAEFEVVFATDGSQYVYHPSTSEEFNKYPVGSAWNLKINSFGQIVEIEPAQ